MQSFYSTVEDAMKLKFAHFAPIEMYFCMVFLFTRNTIFRFWPKTMDYSKAFWSNLEAGFRFMFLD